jgi:phage gp29-like protein
MDKGLWLSDTNFIALSDLKEQKHNPLLGELYSSATLGGFDPISFMGLMPDPDPVLQKTGDGIDVLRSLTADDKVLSCMQNRKLGTLKKQDYLFEPGKLEDKEPDNASKDICKKLVEDLGKINLYNTIAQVLDAPYYGQTPVEIIWEPIDGVLRISGLKPRPVEWFAYNEKYEPVFSGDLMNEPVIPEKLVIARHFPDAKNPYGLRLLSRCLWPVAIKKGGIRFWTILCERFGMPWVIGKVGGADDKAKRDAALTQLTSMVQNAVAVLSKDSEVDVHTLTGKGGDLHPALIRHCDTAIARVLQGQNLTNEGSGGGNYSESKTSKEALGDFQEADEHLAVSFMNDLAKIYTRVNSAHALAPVFRYREPEDYSALAELDTKLHEVGVRFTKVHFKRKYRMKDDEFDLDSGSDSDGGLDPDKNLSSEFSGGQARDAFEQGNIESFCNDLAANASEDTQTAQKTILKAIMASKDYDDAALRILELYPDLSFDRFEGLMEKALFNSTLFGMHTAGQEGDDD